MGKPYVLACRQPPHVSTAIVDRFTELATRYRHSTRWQGGFWEASWSFIPTEENGLTTAYLRDWFENRLMFRHEERSGGIVSWQGIIWAMVLTVDGIREERSVGDVYNAIKCAYTDTTGEAQETSFYTNQNSINRYGRRELILTLDNVNTAQAEAAAQSALVETAEAWPHVIGINPSWPDSLDVQAVGDIFTANNKYVTAAVGSSYNGRISNIISADCEFLTAGGIGVNASVPEGLTINSRAWDVMLELAEHGDGTSPWRLWCDTGSRVWYQAADNTVLYEYHGRNKGLTDTEGNKNPWLVKPGVIRNMRRRSTTPIPGSFLSSGRDSWVLEVEMADWWTEPSLKPAGIAPEEIQNKMDLYQTWLEAE